MISRKSSADARTRCHFAASMAILTAVFGSGVAQAGLPASDVTLKPVVTNNIPVFVSLSGYETSENGAAQTSPPRETPLFTPYNNTSPLWWDNLIAEQLQARVPAIMVASRGAYTLNTTDMTGPGNMNPRRLTDLTAGLSRANATNLLKIACFIDTPALRFISNKLHNVTPGETAMNLSVQSDWNDVFWLRGVKPWFDTVPSSYWYRIDNKPVIQFWSINPPSFNNQNGNASQLLAFIAQQFQATYGESPAFILDGSFFQVDPSVTTVPEVIGRNNWFGPPNSSNRFATYNGRTFGTAVPGFINPTYFNPASSNYNNPNAMIVRNQNGTPTLEIGLSNAVTNNSLLTSIEGWTDLAEWAGLYRSEHPNWAYPNQYINLIQRYSDLRTVTLRLEAEGADFYNDTTTGNSGGVFRRSGDLDIRTLAGTNGGWTVTDTAAGEWVEFKDVNFSPGNYKFPVRYASVTAGKRLRLYVDGVQLPDVTLTATGNVNTFDTASLGQRTMTGGKHTLRVLFVDGGVDLDWLFVRKFDPMMSLQANNNLFVCAEKGGRSTVIANRATAGVWESFSADDTDGGALADGDVIYLQTYNGHFLSASGGGGGALTADKREGSVDEKFTIRLVSGSAGSIVSGYSIALESRTGYYLTVATNGTLNATSPTIGADQTFKVNLTSQ